MSHGEPEADLLKGGKVTGGSDDELAIIKEPTGMVDNLGQVWVVGEGGAQYQGQLHQPGVLVTG